MQLTRQLNKTVEPEVLGGKKFRRAVSVAALASLSLLSGPALAGELMIKQPPISQIPALRLLKQVG